MHKLLIIDDDKELLSVLDIVLTSQDFQVVTSGPFCNIFELVYQHTPDLVIIDYLMSPVNGGELCRLLKENSATKELPIIIISAYDRVFKSIGDYGCNLFLPKVIDSSILIKHITGLLEKRGGVYA